MTRTALAALRRRAGRALAAATLLALAACASAETESTHHVDLPMTWDSIDLADADLTLPLASPFDISTLKKRVGEDRIYQNLYKFRGLRGYVLTSRVFFGNYSEDVSKELRTGSDFDAYAHDLTVPPGGKLKIDGAHRFENGDPRTLGFYTRADLEPGHDQCFVARVGYLMVEYHSVKRKSDSVDTIVDVLLCGRLPRESVLLGMLSDLKAVENRKQFRKDLAKQRIGTI